jgi:cell division control protein 45
MDCRRPVHLANIYAGENVVLFWDQTQGEDVPSDGDNLSGNESSSSEEEDDSEDSDDDDDDTDDEKSNDAEEEAAFEDVVDATERNEAAVDPEAEDQDVDYDGDVEREAGDDTRTRHRGAEETEEGSASSPKRRRTGQEETDGATDVEQSDGDSPDKNQKSDISPRELHRQRRDRLRAYYSTGSFYGSPAAYVALRLAMQLRFGEQSDLLWLSCVGVTDAYLHARLDVAGYTALALDLRRYCLKLFPNDMFERAVSTVYAEQLTGGRGDQENRTKITFSDNGRIIAEKDYRFFLLRHSSLFESMVLSDYVSTKLQVWNKAGMHRLQELLAKMGYPLEECQQPFAFMKPNLRRRLHEKIGAHAAVSKILQKDVLITLDVSSYTFLHYNRIMAWKTLHSRVFSESPDTSHSCLLAIPRMP